MEPDNVRGALPDFLIIGAQKAGTTSLYQYLVRHPDIESATVKEVHFFDLKYGKGLAWYSRFFPSEGRRQARLAQTKELVTGEATPYYLFHPHVPERVARSLPGIKLIVLLRNPIDRAYSHYHHAVRHGFESLDFEQAIASETDRLAPEIERLTTDDSYHSFVHQRNSYLARGRYIEQLERWAAYFSREAMLILEAEAFFADPGAGVSSVHAFLKVRPWALQNAEAYHVGAYPALNPGTRARLRAHFAPFNERLYEFLAADLGWQ
jgi:hypothetical protein